MSRKFKVGQEWMTRSGEGYVIGTVEDIHVDNKYPIAGIRNQSGCVMWFREDGTSCLGNGYHEDDLVKLVKKDTPKSSMNIQIDHINVVVSETDDTTTVGISGKLTKDQISKIIAVLYGN